MPRNLISLILLLLYPFSNIGQQPLNLDFEKKSTEGILRPWGWNSLTWGASFIMDSSNVKSGTYSLFGEGTNQDQSIEFALEPYEIRKKKVNFSGYIKADGINGIVGTSIVYWMLDTKTGEFIDQETEIKSTQFDGTFDWKKVSIESTIPESVVFVKVRLTQKGTGKVWFDDFHLSVDNEALSELSVTKNFTKKQIKWLSKNSYEFNSPNPIAINGSFKNEKLDFFEEAVGDSRIIALGESTHGTSEFFSLKHKLLQYAVLHMGFRTFAIEDHLIVGENMNEFVQTGNGSALTSMSGGFGVWHRAEVLTLVQWIRDYNETHPTDMITVIGLDIQNPTLSIDHFTEFMKNQDLKYYGTIENEIGYLKELGKNAFMVQDSLQQMDWVRRSQIFSNQIAKMENTWLSEACTHQDSIKIAYGVRYALLIHQFFQMTLNQDIELSRDQSMADNLSWYLEEINPNEKVVLWAHDVHISRGDHSGELHNMHMGRSMGSHLSKKHKDNYKSFGIFTYEGSYRAYKTYAYQNLIESPLFTSPKGSIEEAMHQVSEIKNSKNLFFKLDHSQKWLNQRIPVRFANHVSYDYAYWTRYSIPYQFDGVFFIDSTSSAVILDD